MFANIRGLEMTRELPVSTRLKYVFGNLTTSSVCKTAMGEQLQWEDRCVLDMIDVHILSLGEL